MRANHKRVRIIRLSFFYCHTQPGHQRLARRPTLLGGVLSPQTSSLAFVVCRRISHIDHLRTSISRICLGTPPRGGCLRCNTSWVTASRAYGLPIRPSAARIAADTRAITPDRLRGDTAVLQPYLRAPTSARHRHGVEHGRRTPRASHECSRVLAVLAGDETAIWEFAISARTIGHAASRASRICGKQNITKPRCPARSINRCGSVCLVGGGGFIRVSVSGLCIFFGYWRRLA